MNPYTPEPLLQGETQVPSIGGRRFACPPYGLAGLIGRANAELARYDGLLQGIVNPGVLLWPLTTREAMLSSRIDARRVDKLAQSTRNAQDADRWTALRLSTLRGFLLRPRGVQAPP